MTNGKGKAQRDEGSKGLRFTGRGRRRIEAAFDGGAMTSDAGLLLIRERDRKLGLTQVVCRTADDRRQTGKTRHRLGSLMRQRVYAICAGYEDLNDHDTLRHDRVLQLGAERDGVHYVIGLARNARLQRHDAVLGLTATLQQRFARRGVKQRACTEFRYAAQSWPCRRPQPPALSLDRSQCVPDMLTTRG